MNKKRTDDKGRNQVDRGPLDEELKLIYNAISDYITVIDTNYRIISCNRAVEQQFGEDLKGKFCYEVYQARHEICEDCAVKRCFESGKPEYTFQPATPVSKPVEISAYPIFDEKGRITAVVEHGRDISDRIRWEKELRESEERHSSIFANIGIGISAISPQMEIISMNPIMKKWFPHIDIEKRPVCYKSFNTPPRDGVCSYCPAIRTFADGKVHTSITETPTPDGIRHYKVISTPILAEDDSVTAAIEVIEDITERKRVEGALVESEEKYRSLVECAADAIVTADSSGNITDWNKQAEIFFGYTAEEILGKSIFTIIPDGLKDEAVKVLHEAKESGLVKGYRTERLKKDGSLIPVEINVSSIMDSDGGLIGTSGILRDITERHRFEEALRKNEEYVRNIIDNVDEGFLVIGRDFKIQTANKAYCDSFGKHCDEVIGKHCYQVSHNSSQPCYEAGEDCAVKKVLDTGKPSVSVHKHEDAEGNITYVETKAFPLKDSSGRVLNVIETINNITEKYLLEEQQLKTQKLEAIGTLAGGIAHDFNNLLQGVFSYISLAKTRLAEGKQAHDMLKEAEKALSMATSLTRQLLTFSKGGGPITKRISIDSILDSVIKFGLSGSQTDYRLIVDEKLWAIEADEGQLGQVIQNIVINASEAMPCGGTVIVEAKNVFSDNIRLPSEGKYIEISIKDTGYGIADEHLSRIFDPYFTTKRTGSGLGLATSYAIIRKHDGIIDVRSEINKGTEFFIYLRAVEAGVEEEVSPYSVKEKTTGRVLFMDDEDVVRESVGMMLRVLGHEAVLAEHGEEAIEKYKEGMESGRPFDIVILDLTIRGGMGGNETYNRLLEINQNVKIIVSSGYSDDAIISRYQSSGFPDYLEKPYTIADLEDKINVLLSIQTT
jgi:PAS domain S-box-containing protein